MGRILSTGSSPDEDKRPGNCTQKDAKAVKNTKLKDFRNKERILIYYLLGNAMNLARVLEEEEEVDSESDRFMKNKIHFFVILILTTWRQVSGKCATQNREMCNPNVQLLCKFANNF